jgi:hypothetical protein
LTTVDKTYTTVVPVVTPTRSLNSPAEGSEACEVPATVTSTITIGTSTTTVYPETSTTTVYIDEDEATTTGVPTYTHEEESTKIPGSTRKTSTSYTTMTIPTMSTGIATYEEPYGTSTVTVTPIQTITISTKLKGVPAETSDYVSDSTTEYLAIPTIPTRLKGVPAKISDYVSDSTTTEYLAIPTNATPTSYPYPSTYPSGYPGISAGNGTTPHYPVESVPVYTGAASRQTVGLGLSIVIAGVLGAAALL